VILAIVLAIILAIVFGTSSLLHAANGNNASASKPSSSATSTPTPSPTPTGPTADQVKAVIDSVTLKKNAVLDKCPANLKDPKTGLLSIDDYSELGPRANSFAFNVPLPSGTPVEKFVSWQGYNCVNELQGTTYAWVLANTPVYGTLVGNIPGNEFLGDLVGISESEIRQYMMDKFHPVLDPNDVQLYVNGTEEYETFITLVNTLYEQLYIIDDAAHNSYINWEVSGPSLGYPEVVKSNVGDTLPAVTLTILEKGVCKPVAAILINDQDQRPERANLPGCVTPPKPTPPPTSTSCTPKPGGTKKWDANLGKYICKDPPSDGPGAKGNDGGGAGLGDGTGTLTTTPPKPKPSPTVTPTPTPTATGDPGGF